MVDRAGGLLTRHPLCFPLCPPLCQVARENYHGWHADPQLLLDYRCWVEGGEVGKNYPPKMKQCLARIAGMTHTEVEREYGMPNNKTAFNLWQRAKGVYAGRVTPLGSKHGHGCLVLALCVLCGTRMHEQVHK
jgi:hypothetical protein